MSRIELLEVIGLVLVVLSASILFFESSRVSEANMLRITGILEELRERTVELEFAIVAGDLPSGDDQDEFKSGFTLPENTIVSTIEAHAEQTARSFSYLRGLRSVGFWAFLTGSALVIFGRCLSIRAGSNKARIPSPITPRVD